MECKRQWIDTCSGFKLVVGTGPLPYEAPARLLADSLPDYSVRRSTQCTHS